MVDRVVLGILPGGGYGLRVSRPGFDANNPALVANQLAFDSSVYDAANLIGFGQLAGGQSVTLSGYAEPPYMLWVEKPVSYSSWAGPDRYLTTSYAVEVGVGSFSLDGAHPGGFYVLWRP
ncbi:hypothetical protein [Maritalea sp.]|jgi:hypothetical protein|uniref:hypothetical protein n=1 Tax=Maritalea sp. TaxID=2003361 RepID=UPI0039E368E4